MGTPIKLVRDPDADDPHWPNERCCFCWQPSAHWAQPQDVACCEACARKHTAEELPEKMNWIDEAKKKFPSPVLWAEEQFIGI